MTRSKLEKLITDFVIQNDLDASFVQQTEGLTYVRFVVEEDYDWREHYPKVDCMCEICFGIANQESKVKWNCTNL